MALNVLTYLPPKPTGNPLKPPTGFTQCGSWLGMPSVSEIGLKGAHPAKWSALDSEHTFTLGFTNKESEPVNDDEIFATELDSHADSTVVRWYSSVLEDTGRKAKVTGLTSELGKSMTVQVVTAVVVYDWYYTGKTYIFSDIQHTLLPKHVHETDTPYNDASSRPRHGWITKVLVMKTNGKKSLYLLPYVGHKATVPYWRNNLLSTHREAAEGWTQGIWRRVYASDTK